MPRHKKFFRRKRKKNKRRRRKNRSKKTYSLKTTNPSVLTTVPRGLPRGPDSLFPSVYKTTLHTRFTEQIDAGTTPVNAEFIELTLNKAGNPKGTSLAYGINPYAAQSGTTHEPGSIQRDPMNLFNYYQAAYVTYAVVRATFIPDATAAGSSVPNLVALTPGCNGDVDIAKSFGLQLSAAGGTLANLEEIPGVMLGISNQSISEKCTTLQRGYRIKTILGAPRMIGDREYATEYDRGNEDIVLPSYQAKMAIIVKDLASNINPVNTTVVVDVYQVTLFLNPRTRDLTRNSNQ